MCDLSVVKEFSCSFPEIYNLKIYNKLMFFKTAQTNTKNVIQYSCAVSFQVFGLFCITWLTPRALNFGLIGEK
jgi:hypothetical protein